MASYQILKYMGGMIMDRSHPYHAFLADPMVKITNHIPSGILGRPQSWVNGLSPEAVA